MINGFDDVIIYMTLFFSLFTSIFFISTYLSVNGQKTENNKTTRYPKISIIIPAYNEGKNIIDTIKNVLGSDYPKKEVIVVDDESSDNTYQKAKNMSSDVVRVFTKKHSGKADSVNFGIKKATGEILMILDADTITSKDCLKNIVHYFDDPKVMAALPTIKIQKPKNLVEKCQAIEYVIMTFFRKIYYFIGSVNCTPAGAFIRRNFFSKYGGFDKNNLTEDFEMGLRIQSKNYKIVQSSTSQVYTIIPNNFKRLLRQRVRWSYGTLKNLFKYRNMINPKYGDLGVFVLPLTIFFMGLISFIFIYSLVRIIFDIVHRIYLYNLIGFDIISNLKIETIDFIKLITNEKTFLIILTFLIGFLIYELARKSIKEKFRIEYVFYLLIYAWVISLSQIIAIFYFIIRKEPPW